MNQVYKILIPCMLFLGMAADDMEFREERDKMVRYQIENEGITDKNTLYAMRKVERHRFVPEGQIRRAYRDSPLPIGYGQTISQPFIVAYMTEIIRPSKDMRVLEIGSGSGYQAAILAEIVKAVYTVEIIPELHESVKKRFAALEYKNIFTLNGDGYYGWKEHSPFDAIIVTAAAEYIPPPLIEQLKEGGRMVIPVGSPFLVQSLVLIEKINGRPKTRNLLPVRFVPLTGNRSFGDLPK